MTTTQTDVKALECLEELANMPLGISMEDWCRLSGPILSAFQSAGADGWRDMKDAPKDGTRVIGSSPRWGSVRTIYWADGMWLLEGGTFCEPAGWMPLPSTPGGKA